jgi:hypothetical protein
VKNHLPRINGKHFVSPQGKSRTHPGRFSGPSLVNQGLNPLLRQNLSGFQVYHNYGKINCAGTIFFAPLPGLRKLGLAKAAATLLFFLLSLIDPVFHPGYLTVGDFFSARVPVFPGLTV